MSQPNVSEDLVEECERDHKDEMVAIRADRYREMDTSGIDYIISFLIRLPGRQARAAFPMALMLQIKTSDNLETIGVVLPASEDFLQRNEKRISRKMHWRIRKHYKAHPLVTCMLFVSQLKNGKTRESVKKEIWRELCAIRRYIARYCFRFLDK